MMCWCVDCVSHRTSNEVRDNIRFVHSMLAINGFLIILNALSVPIRPQHMSLVGIGFYAPKKLYQRAIWFRHERTTYELLGWYSVSCRESVRRNVSSAYLAFISEAKSYIYVSARIQSHTCAIRAGYIYTTDVCVCLWAGRVMVTNATVRMDFVPCNAC